MQRQLPSRKSVSAPFAPALLLGILGLFGSGPAPARANGIAPDPVPYRAAILRFADRVLESGRDRHGPRHTPLFADGLHATTLAPAIWKGPGGKDWILSNFASQQSLIRLLDGLTGLTGEPGYRDAADRPKGRVLGFSVRSDSQRLLKNLKPDPPFALRGLLTDGRRLLRELGEQVLLELGSRQQSAFGDPHP
jgi:hypothetical protein